MLISLRPMQHVSCTEVWSTYVPYSLRDAPYNVSTCLPDALSELSQCTHLSVCWCLDALNFCSEFVSIVHYVFAALVLSLKAFPPPSHSAVVRMSDTPTAMGRDSSSRRLLRCAYHLFPPFSRAKCKCTRMGSNGSFFCSCAVLSFSIHPFARNS